MYRTHYLQDTRNRYTGIKDTMTHDTEIHNTVDT